ncbi:DUF7713 domain-containing protein [Paraburkholderia sacchari]|uniref:DUF7713 domain-containing protein n=1 Tax=Paraburkholderia sacchari TaxID=159450 RepID=UPI001F2AA8FF|nr:hypothetical protein [Paraburkholderia sacchari]
MHTEVVGFPPWTFRFRARMSCGNELIERIDHGWRVAFAVTLRNFELRGELRAGYRFQLIGEADDDVFVLLGRLVEKMRRALSVRHIDFRERRIIDSTGRGHIEWDESHAGRLPLVVVDGTEVSWNELGQMLMSMEGWQFRLDIADPSEEL